MKIKPQLLFLWSFFSCFFVCSIEAGATCIKGRDVSIITNSCCETNCLTNDCLTWECIFCTDEISTQDCDEECDLKRCGTWHRYTGPTAGECDRWVCCSTDPQTTLCRQTCCAVEVFTINTEFYCADPDCAKIPRRTVRWQ